MEINSHSWSFSSSAAQQMCSIFLVLVSLLFSLVYLRFFCRLEPTDKLTCAFHS